MASPLAGDVELAVYEPYCLMQDIANHPFTVKENGLECNRDLANMFFSARTGVINAYDNTVNVRSIQRFQLLKKNLLELPMYVTCKLKYFGINHSGSTQTKQDTFIIALNTKHAKIQRQFKDALLQAEQCLERGKN